MNKSFPIASSLVLLVILMQLMFLEVHAIGCNDVNVDCTHFPNYEWDPYDVGTGVGIHAWSDIYYSWYENQEWYFKRVAGYLADELPYGDLRCYRSMYGCFSDTDYISSWSGLTWVDKEYPPNPPYGQYYYIQYFEENDAEYTQACYAEATAWFYEPPDTDDLWYCFSSCSVDRW
jgi:hypothetical protein